jgi:hypothetical protein
MKGKEFEPCEERLLLLAMRWRGVLGSCGFFSGDVLAADVPNDPIYVAIDNGWMGLYGHQDEYAKFSLPGKGVQIQDAHHVLLGRGLGMMVNYADKKDFSEGADLLADHARWELNYWRSRADRVESSTRSDLSGTRQDLKITEMRLYRNIGDKMTVYLIGLASREGVFVMSISPGDQSVEPLVEEIARSFTLVTGTLSPEEVARVARTAKSGTKARPQ